MKPGLWWPLAGMVLVAATQAMAGGLPTLDVVEVSVGSSDLVGSAGSATEGTVTAQQLANRPLLRPTEVLETVPGLIVTQHSGDGKANQYFLRGFNLDHGTDFATFVDGMPINLPTQAHGQGYTDLNFLIPELVDTIQYRKGTYSAEDGDFSATGSAHLEYKRRLPQDFDDITIGENGYMRNLLATSAPMAQGDLVTGLELYHNDGPWDVAENNRKINGVMRYSRGDADDGWSLSLMAYHAKWTATDQIAQRAVDNGDISRFGSLDPSDGGETHRLMLAGNWASKDANGKTRANFYAYNYSFDLFSNFTYYLNNPDLGDQIEQVDRRNVFGGSVAHTFFGSLGGMSSDTILGSDLRDDEIGKVALFLSSQRQRYGGVNDDRVRETSAGLYVENTTQWSTHFRSIAGLRSDSYYFNVNANVPGNSGVQTNRIASPKLGLVFGPWQQTELYANYGYGFHSNDARGTTLSVDPDPRNGSDYLQPTSKVSALVRDVGSEIGLRTAPLPGLQTTLAFWQLHSASELVFSGDAGTTDPGRPSQRRGIEFTNYYYPSKSVVLDADLALSSARFTDTDPVGSYVPEAIRDTFSAGLSYEPKEHWFYGLRLRYFGPRPLIEDNSVRSSSSLLVNARLGYHVNSRLQVSADVLNLLNRQVNDIQYYYNACLRQEQSTSECSAQAASRSGIAGSYFHPTEPRTLRLSLRQDF